MRAYEIQGSFGFDNLKLADRPDPEPGPGEVVVDTKAASLNYRDLMMIQGLYNPKQPLPLVPLSDGAGVVSAVGEGVESVSVGDRVVGLFFQDWMSGEPTAEKCQGSSVGGPIDGWLAERVLMKAEGVVMLPDDLSFEAAATLPCAGLTAWNALFELGNVQPGDTVLTLGTGGVSIFALQFARAAGAQVISTSSSIAKLSRLSELGAEHTINYKDHEAWGKMAYELADGGADHVVEVGGAGTLQQSISAVRIGGTISVIGVLSGVETPLAVVPMLMKQIRMQGVFVGHREMFERMLASIVINGIEPAIDQVFAFEDAQGAMAHMAAGGHFGKVVIGRD